MKRFKERIMSFFAFIGEILGEFAEALAESAGDIFDGLGNIDFD